MLSCLPEVTRGSVAGTFRANSSGRRRARQRETAAEELFGPIVTLTSFRDEADAAQLANGSDYGLASYVYTRDAARAHRMVDRLDAGMTGISVGVISNDPAPFGGIRQAGIRREGGPEGLLEYLDLKYAAFANPFSAAGA